MAVVFCLHLVATGAVHTAAAGSALALSIILSCCNIHHYGLSVAAHFKNIIHALLACTICSQIFQSFEFKV